MKLIKDNISEKLSSGNPTDMLTDELAELHKMYHSNVLDSAQKNKSIVLRITPPNPSTLNEHHQIENDLFAKHGIRMIEFFPFKESMKHIRFDEISKKLFYLDFEISIVYFRTGYTMSFYKLENSMLEEFMLMSGKSMAICTPNVRTFLVNMKHFQKFLQIDEFQKRLGLTKEHLGSVLSHSTQMKHIKLDFGSDKAKMIDFVSQNSSKYHYFVYLIYILSCS